MSLFHRKSPSEKQLEILLSELQMNMANNYKDNAIADFKKLSEAFGKMKDENLLPAKIVERYEKVIAEYQEKLVGYAHNDQKPYWTKEALQNDKQ